MKRNVVRRSLAWLLVLVMALSAVPFGVFAESTEQVSDAGTEEAPGGAVSPVEPQQEEPKPEEPKVQDIQDEDTQVETAPKCLCEDAAKCTENSVNEKCPVCAEKDADLEKMCKGKTQEQLNAEAEAKKAEEEAEKKAAEEAAQKASEEAVKNVQALIDALPEADAITEENREAVETALNAIDDAKEKLTDEERGKLDFTRYDAAAEALNALEGMPEAGAPVTLEETNETMMTLSLEVKWDGKPCYSKGEIEWYVVIGTTEIYRPKENENSVTITKPASSTYSYTVYIYKNGKEVKATQGFWTSTKSDTISVFSTSCNVDFKKGDFFEDAVLVNKDSIKEYFLEQKPVGYSNIVLSISAYGGNSTNFKIEKHIIRKVANEEREVLPDIAKDLPVKIRVPNVAENHLYLITNTDGSPLNGGEKYWIEGSDLLLENFQNEKEYSIKEAVEITYDATGGTVDGAETASERVAKGVEHTLKTPTKTGWEFIGWYRLGSVDRFTKLTPTEDVTLYAQWIPIHYRVYFNPDGGEVVKGESMIQRLQYKEDFSNQVPTVRKAGKMFCYWKYYESGKKVETFEKLTDQEGETVDLIAEWDNATCSFESENGQTTVEITSGDGKLTSLPDPGTKAGYDFLGWYIYEIDDKQGNKENVNIRVTLDTVFYGASKLRARWVKTTADGSAALAGTLTPEQVEGILWNETPNADYGDTIDIHISSADAAATDAIRAKARELLGGEPSRLDCLEITVSANNTQKHELGKTILLDLGSRADYGSSLKILRTHNGATAEIPQGKPADDVTEGWYVENGRIYLAVRNFSLYALASAPYTVTFDSKGGSKTPAKQTTDADGKLTSLPDAGTKEGNNFAYWYQKDAAGNETEVKANDTIFTADTIVYAKWNPWTYTVAFYNGENLEREQKNVPYDTETALDTVQIGKQYYTLAGWDTDSAGKTVVYKTDAKIQRKEANGAIVKLYAVWEYVPRTVTFNANGVDNNNNPTKGTVTEDGTDKDKVERKTQETPINTLKTLPVPNAQDGYYFEGWYYQDKNDKNKEKLVKVGDTVFTEDTEVYAKWTVFEPVTVTLKCQRGNMTINGKTVTTTTMETKWPGVIDGTLPTAARSGYKFDGWYTAAGVKVTEDTVFLRDTTIYARFTSAVSRTGNPKTGDRAMLGAAVAVLVVAAVGLGAAVVITKKKK